MRQQAGDIQKKTGWSYPACFIRAVEVFFGDIPVRYSGFGITMKNHCDGDIFEHSFRL